MSLATPTVPDAVAYRAVAGRDPRFDGRLFVCVLSTGIYCRPSCPSRTPKAENCRFRTSAAACVAAGFRACRRCRPDALPGSRDWDVGADVAGRALRMIGDGAVDDGGVAGLARRLDLSERHLHRVLVAEVGASPAQLARTRRAQLARMLIEQTRWPMSDIAFAAGFSSIRQFNDVVRAEFGAPPTRLRPAVARRRARRPTDGAELWPPTDGSTTRAGAAITLRLRHAQPYDASALLSHLAPRAVPGLEVVEDGTVRRILSAGGGPALAVMTPGSEHLAVRLTLASLQDLPRLVGRLRHWADLDADPVRVAEVLGDDPLLAPLVAARPGLRVPGTADPAELVIRTVLGQQVSVAAARTLTARLVDRLGEPTPLGLSRFPDAGSIAAAGTDALRHIGLTGARAETVARLAEVLDGGLELGPGADRAAVREALAAVPGVGPWTLDYVALRALGDPDAFPAHDLVLRRALGGVSAAQARARAERWRPWRGYAAQHLWTAEQLRMAEHRRGASTRTEAR